MRDKDRQGSRMSDRQMARAATSGRRMTFHLPPEDLVEGYLVGSDDFHWLVAHLGDNYKAQISLVHKGSASRIDLSPDPTLDGEAPYYQEFVTRIGRGFWLFCDKTYLGKTDPADTQLEKAS